MQSRRLGATALPVSEMGLGLAALGRPAYITTARDADLGPERDRAALERRTHEVLDAAYAAGIRYVDAARSYGLAESFLASWLAARGVSPTAITVGSKWGYRYVGGWRIDAPVHEIKDHSVSALRRQLAESRTMLADHLRLYQIHSATLETGVLDDQAVLAELVHQRETGLAIGMTVSGPGQPDVIRRALDAEVDGVNPFESVQATWNILEPFDGVNPFESVQATWNILEPSCGPALAEAHTAGWGVIIKEAVANGRLTPHGETTAHPVLTRIGARHGLPLDQLALAFALAQPWADIVLSGAVTTAELRSNTAATTLGLDDKDKTELAQLAEPPAQYWRYRSSLPWA